MKATVKKSLCVLNAVLTIGAYLFVHAAVWLIRGSFEQVWFYLDENTATILLPAFIAFAISFWSILWNPLEKSTKVWYIIAAVLNAIPTLLFTVLSVISLPIDYEEMMLLWRVYIAISLYFVATVLYFVIAFVKTKQEDKTDEPIPYSD